MRRHPLILALALALLAQAAPAPAMVPIGGGVRLADGGTSPLGGRARENVVAFARLLAYVRWFHPSDQAVKADWGRVAVAALPEVERAQDAPALVRALSSAFRPLAPTVRIHLREHVAPLELPRPKDAPRPMVAAWTHAGLGQRARAPFAATRHLVVAPGGRPPAGLPAPGEVHDADLGAGVACRVPLALWAAHEGTLPAVPLPPAPAVPGTLTAERRAVRLAAVATAWGALQHFHPRLERGAWAGLLPAALAEAAEAPDAPALERVLRRMVARLDDGLAGVRGPGRAPARPAVALAWVEERLVVTAVHPGRAPGVAVGDEVLAIDGETAGARMAAALEGVGGATPARRRWVAARDVLAGRPGKQVALRLARPGRAPWTAALKRSLVGGGATPVRPPAIGPTARGAWYVDLTRVDERTWRRARPRLARATGVVFDLRGAVNARAMAHVLGGLAGREVRTPGFEVPQPRRPEDPAPTLGFQAYLIPAGEALPARAAFLIDASTIDVGDMVAATVAHHRLGKLVGAPTAGAVGHVEGLALPGGFSLAWTGSDARGYDGRPLGPVRPDELVPATVAGLREGRDEALERALALVETNEN